jgi:hypothetical protein
VSAEGEFLLASGEHNRPVQYEAWLQEVIEVAWRQGARSWDLRAAATLVRLLACRSRSDEARRVLEEVCAWITEGFETADLNLAAELLNDLRDVEAGAKPLRT